ncbi:hypothetical protein ABID28_001889 [Streptococcus porcorum]|uniref:Uncharacterized protein n=1 Tax=Streptococcus porcorum TaxID=701526 RepID=A0ABV2JHJ2_9STRE
MGKKTSLFQYIVNDENHKVDQKTLKQKNETKTLLDRTSVEQLAKRNENLDED